MEDDERLQSPSQTTYACPWFGTPDSGLDLLAKDTYVCTLRRTYSMRIISVEYMYVQYVCMYVPLPTATCSVDSSHCFGRGRYSCALCKRQISCSGHLFCVFFCFVLAGRVRWARAVWMLHCAVRNIGRAGGEGALHGPWMIAPSFLEKLVAPAAGAGKPLQPFPFGVETQKQLKKKARKKKSRCFGIS